MKGTVKLDTALLLRKRGFHIPVTNCTQVYYIPEGEIITQQEDTKYTLGEDFVVAPSLSEVQEWLREEYKLHTAVYRMNGHWCSQIYSIPRGCYLTNPKLFNSYYEALEEGIVECINNLDGYIKQNEY